LGALSAVVLAALTLFGGAAAVLGALALTGVTAGLPELTGIEAVFGPPGQEAFVPTRLVDRSGSTLIFEATNPSASSRRWLSVDRAALERLPASFLQATIAYEDPSFWTSRGYALRDLLTVMLGGAPRATITESLAGSALLPLDDLRKPTWMRAVRQAILASRLTAAYPKERILEWYINTAYYGNLAYGIDAAALVYFGKHASELDLAQSAMLAAIPTRPDLNPIDAPTAARQRQRDVLQAMAGEGMISSPDVARAAGEALRVQPGDLRATLPATDFGWYAWEWLLRAWGPDFARRGALRVVTSEESDLQAQVECVVRTQMARLAGGDPGAVQPAADGSACLAAGLLPPVRPGDAGVDHRVADAAAVVLDPATGEVLSIVGDPGRPHAAGEALTPLIYLTAFARGYTPGTMVLDLPVAGAEAVSSEAALAGYRGPVRMRTALANGYHGAAVRTIDLVGVEQVARIAQQMGITTLSDSKSDLGASLADGSAQASPIELAYAYGVMANEGQLVGAESEHDRPLDPILVLRIETSDGSALGVVQQAAKPVLSRPLAYLMDDVLSDETARWPSLGQGNILEVGRPAAVVTSADGRTSDSWTIGFTRGRVVAVWLGNLDGTAARGLTALSGAAPIWHALIQYSTRELSAQGWSLPVGVSEVQVCDPSGLLPTQYCPNVVREVFVQGTEPTHYDDLYQPFRIDRETGKLATLFTPLDLVEEKIYLVPPPEAAGWAALAGIERPPQEYDTIYAQPAQDPDVAVTAPAMFATLRGRVDIRGSAAPKGFEYYRLQYGQGLNPTRWTQIGQDVRAPVGDGALASWDTQGLSGLYALQLVVVRQDGQVNTAAVAVTIDNQAPSVRLVLPEPGQTFTWPRDQEAVIQAEASDDLQLARVEFYVDGAMLEAVEAPPYSTRWPLGRFGDHVLFARAYDMAGNTADSERVTIHIAR
jgi:membrane peptidoglycan carboxypeptidase